MSQPNLSVLLIEDNLALGKQICRFLEGCGWDVDYAEKGRPGIQLALDNHYDVIVLDLNLPDIDGLEVCQQIKQLQTRITPILMLTARDAFEDKAKGFRQGTDDYLTKPCDLRELALRCEALARRPALHSETQLSCGQLTLDCREQRANWQGNPVPLTQIGFKILHQLMQTYPSALTRSDLIAHIWGSEPPQSNALKSHIYSLRKTLEGASQKQLIQTINNVGFKLQDVE